MNKKILKWNYIMKFIILATLIAIFAFQQTSFSAGIMRNVNQDISLQNAEITTQDLSSGGTANAAYGLVKLNKEPGNITIGEIENKNGKMENINQKINGDNAKIRANGASITIGRISNK